MGKRSILVLPLATLLTAVVFAAPGAAEKSRTESTRDFGECRAFLQVYAGALSGKLATYQINTPEKLESTFRANDGTLVTITCIASKRLMIVTEDK